MTTREKIMNLELVHEMNEVWLELVNLQAQLDEYCKNIQIDMLIKTTDDMIAKCEYFAVVVMEIYNKMPEHGQMCETMLLKDKQMLDNLNKLKELNM